MSGRCVGCERFSVDLACASCASSECDKVTADLRAKLAEAERQASENLSLVNVAIARAEAAEAKLAAAEKERDFFDAERMKVVEQLEVTLGELAEERGLRVAAQDRIVAKQDRERAEAAEEGRAEARSDRDAIDADRFSAFERSEAAEEANGRIEDRARAVEAEAKRLRAALMRVPTARLAKADVEAIRAALAPSSGGGGE